MKIEQLLVQHFYSAKKITLQGIGTFTLSPDFVMPKETDKDAEIPENAISFQYSSRATEDDDLINFIVQQTRKIKPLASADLDSYLVLGKQFLNIGKPFKIEGLGMLAKNQQGEYLFTQGNSFHNKTESAKAALKDKTEEADISFASDIKPATGSKKGLLITLLIVWLGLVGTSLWYFLIRDTKSSVKNITSTTVTPDTSKAVTAGSDSVKNDTATLIKPLPIPVNTGYTFKVVFLITRDSNAAVARMNVLTNRGHKVIMYRQDSTRFRLAEPCILPLSDTTHVKDSLNNFYYL